MIATTTFYKRPLPATCVPFSSDAGRAIFQEALDAGTLASYFVLAEQFHTQADPAFCGLGTLVVVLNALAIDPGPGRPWKGPWRWFSEEHLDCCRPLSEVQRTGLTMPQLACLARCNGARVEVRHGESVTLEMFRQVLRETACTSGEPHLVVSYDRGSLGQTGSGHFSPVGGYHEGRDLVLILDVARFKYPPHWVPLPDLHRAMQPRDPETGRSRGFLRFWRHTEVASLCSLQATDTSWRTLLGQIFDAGSVAAGSTEALIERLLHTLPLHALQWARPHAADGSTSSDVASAQAILQQDLERTEIMHFLRAALPQPNVNLAEIALFLLSLPAHVFRSLAPPLREQMEKLQQLDGLPKTVRQQVEYLRVQAEALDEINLCPPSPPAATP